MAPRGREPKYSTRRRWRRKAAQNARDSENLKPGINRKRSRPTISAPLLQRRKRLELARLTTPNLGEHEPAILPQVT